MYPWGGDWKDFKGGEDRRVFVVCQHFYPLVLI